MFLTALAWLIVIGVPSLFLGFVFYGICKCNESALTVAAMVFNGFILFAVLWAIYYLS